MLSNNGSRLNLWCKLKNKFDYHEFTELCSQHGIAPQPVFEFAQKAGMLSCALLLYPNLPAAEAYLRLIEDHQQETITTHSAPPVRFTATPAEQSTVTTASTNCGSCGGGKVR